MTPTDTPPRWDGEAIPPRGEFLHLLPLLEPEFVPVLHVQQHADVFTNILKESGLAPAASAESELASALAAPAAPTVGRARTCEAA